jgi:hypothetical protein
MVRARDPRARTGETFPHPAQAALGGRSRARDVGEQFNEDEQPRAARYESAGGLASRPSSALHSYGLGAGARSEHADQWRSVGLHGLMS